MYAGRIEHQVSYAYCCFEEICHDGLIFINETLVRIRAASTLLFTLPTFAQATGKRVSFTFSLLLCRTTAYSACSCADLIMWISKSVPVRSKQYCIAILTQNLTKRCAVMHPVNRQYSNIIRIGAHDVAFVGNNLLQDYLGSLGAHCSSRDSAATTRDDHGCALRRNHI